MQQTAHFLQLMTTLVGYLFITIGLLCDDDIFNVYTPQSIASLQSNYNLSPVNQFQPRNLTKPLWAFSNRMILLSGAPTDEYYVLTKTGNYFSHRIYYHNKTNQIEPILSSTQDFRYAQVVYDSILRTYQVSVHSINFTTLLIYRDLLNYNQTTQPAATLLKQYGISKLYTSHPFGTRSEIRVFNNYTSNILSYYSAANITTPSQNCASVLATSKKYLAAACPLNNIITIYNNTLNTYEQICTVNGPSGALFGEHLAFYQHSNSTGNQTSIATLFVSGFISTSNLHFVTQIHIIPSRTSNNINCFSVNLDADFLVSHNFTSGYSSSQLQLGLSQNYLLIYLKTKQEIYTSDKRALYKTQLNSFFSNSSTFCPQKHYSTSVYSSQPCTPCKETVDPSTHPLQAFIKEGVCCPSITQHGPSCLECTEYMSTIGATLPQFSEWVNGQHCTSQCINGYQHFKLTGVCEISSLVNKASYDTCFNPTTCEQCNVNSCYFNGGDCTLGSINRINVLRDIRGACGRNSSFCGASSLRYLNLNSEGSLLKLNPQGDNGVLKGILCEWTIVLNSSSTNQPQTIEFVKNSQVTSDAYIIAPNGSYYLLQSDKPIQFNSSISFGLSQIAWFVKVGLLSYQDHPFNSIQIEVRKPQQSAQTPSSSLINTTFLILIIIGGVCILGVIIIIILCCVYRKRKVNGICLLPLDSLTIQTICSHTFHKKCIDQWLGDHQICPLCRTQLKN